MKDFSWKYFYNTGQIDAYLLFKDVESIQQDKELSDFQKLE
ncbi:YqzL family protein [Vulcanibacillus modesticaldus]|nr:YqzL family protein [Vulcanibacillus modesticaldus]